jgi:hypothetical protein
MANYRKKPIIVDAEQFHLKSNRIPFAPLGIVNFDEDGWYVTTIHGQRTPIADGDWIIREAGTTDKAYPCKDDIFRSSYESVS